MQTLDEIAANEALTDALKALQRARERAAYGSQVLVPLSDAHNEVIYALDVVVGRI